MPKMKYRESNTRRKSRESPGEVASVRRNCDSKLSHFAKGEPSSFWVSTFGDGDLRRDAAQRSRSRTREKRTGRMENSLSSVSTARGKRPAVFRGSLQTRRESRRGKSRDAGRHIRSQLTGELLMKPNVRSARRGPSPLFSFLLFFLRHEAQEFIAACSSRDDSTPYVAPRRRKIN